MKIAINLGQLNKASNSRGIGVYTRELITALGKKYISDTILTDLSRAEQPDVIHYPYFDPFFRTLVVTNIPTVVTIHDLIPLRFPAHFPVGIKGKINWWYQKRAIQKVSHIITDSLSSKNDIIKIVGVDSEKISVVPLGPNHTQKIRATLSKKIATSYSLPKKYLLYVGDINWNKNVTGLIKSFSELEDKSLHLILVGKVFSDKPDIPEYLTITEAIARSRKADKIIQLGFVPSHHLSVLYQLATIYVQPSWYEGFGLPILEAMKFGCPVASSDRGSLSEVGGDAVLYFDPKTGMTEAIKKLLNSGPLRKELSEKGIQQAKNFTWEKTAILTHAVYEKVLSNRA